MGIHIEPTTYPRIETKVTTLCTQVGCLGAAMILAGPFFFLRALVEVEKLRLSYVAALGKDKGEEKWEATLRLEPSSTLPFTEFARLRLNQILAGNA